MKIHVGDIVTGDKGCSLDKMGEIVYIEDHFDTGKYEPSYEYEQAALVAFKNSAKEGWPLDGLGYVPRSIRTLYGERHDLRFAWVPLRHLKVVQSNVELKYKVGDRLLFKLDGQKYGCKVIYIDMGNKNLPYLCSFFEDKIDAKTWKLSYSDFDEFDSGLIPNSVIGDHFTEYVRWVQEDQLELEDLKLEEVKDEQEGEPKMTAINYETLDNQKQLVKLGIKSLADNIDYALVHDFRNVPRRNLTKTALHNQIIQLRYQLKDLDELIARYY